MPDVASKSGGLLLADVFPQAHILGDDRVRVQSCCGNVSSCQPGDLYVALLDDKADGHDDIQAAVAQGAAAVIAERPIPTSVPVCVVRDSRVAFGEICQALAGNPSQQMGVVGVSGTNGKTTTSALITSVLTHADRPTGLMNSIEHHDAIEFERAYGDPSPVELAQWMGRMAANGCAHAVIEASSRMLAERRLAGIELQAAVLTNVRRDHIDFHNSVSNYRSAKKRLLSHISHSGFAVLNADDAFSKWLLKKLDVPTITVAMRGEAELTARLIERFPSEQTFLLSAGNESIPVRTQIVGDQHIYNCLSAAAVGLVMGIDLASVVRGLERVSSVAGRMERLECGQPFSVFVDAASTPDTLAAALRTMRQVTSGRVICLYGADARRDPNQRPLLGKAVERAADVHVITNDNPCHEKPYHIIHDILDGYQRPASAHVMPDRARAIIWALEQARPGDSVLIAGKGDEDLQIVGDTHFAWDDREIAQQWLYDHAADMPVAIEPQRQVIPMIPFLN